MRHDKLTYKLAIRNKESNSKNQFSDDLNDALLCKDINRFWQSWRSKFGHKPRSMIIDGCCEEKSLADRFASVFQSVCIPNTADRHKQLLTEFSERFAQYRGSCVDIDIINVELVQKCISQLKKGRAAGVDGISVEHITLAHPILVVQLTLLFNIIYTHSIVPDDFSKGLVIPLLKNVDGNQFVSENYRGITLSPVISKLFEMVMMAIFEKQLNSDPLQFGFKKKSSCSNALFTFKTVIDHYVKCSSTVTVCALDISKAFDRVDHYALMNLLMDRLLPNNFISILLDWFTKCFVCVRWGDALSFWFQIYAGVRQGGVLSPVLFAIYIWMF